MALTMCEWGDTVDLLVPIPAERGDAVQWDTKPVDRCVAPLVQALNSAGFWTGGACCGHGKGDGTISLHDGTVLVLRHFVPGEPRPREWLTGTPPCGIKQQRTGEVQP